jgi:hypothetical protein
MRYRSARALPVGLYWEVFDGLEQLPDDPVCGDLADDVRDIYVNVKEGLALYDAGHADEAVWHWRLMLSHWGHHATGAIRALHLYLQEADG